MAARQTPTALTGLTPMPASMLAGIATAVPKPAMPSKKPPKPKAIRRISTLRSALTEVSMALMISMPPVCTDRW